MRSSLRLAAAVALAAALPLAPRTASAQAPCADGSLADYLVLGFSCDIGSWRFSDFSLFGSADATGSATATTVDPLATLISPFSTFDALGRRTFGFSLVGFQAQVQTAGGGTDAGIGLATAELGFATTSTLPGAVLSRAGAWIFARNASDTPGRVDLFSRAAANVADLSSGAECLRANVETGNAGQRSFTGSQRCEPSRPGSVYTSLRVEALASRGTSVRTAPAVAEAYISEVTYTIPGVVVPEPSTYALLGTGLLALGGVAARRRRG